MAKKLEEGVWRTIGGRRVFIRTGQSLKDAMKESGKFESKKKEYNSKDYDDAFKAGNGVPGRLRYKDYASYGEEKEVPTRKEYDKNPSEYENGTNSYDDFIDYLHNDRRITDKQYNAIKSSQQIKNEDKFYTRKDGTKEYDPYKGTPYEKKYDSVDEVIKDPNSALNKYIKEKEKQDEVIKNVRTAYIYQDEGEMSSGLARQQETYGKEAVAKAFKYYDDNYVLVRGTNADTEGVTYNELISKGDYPIEAINEYKRGIDNLRASRLQYDNYAREYNRQARELRDKLEKSKNTSKEHHFAGEELYSDDPNRFGDKMRAYNEKMYKEQQESAKRVQERYELTSRYKGTVDYLKQTTNMSPAQILELLKKIDSDKK